MLSAPSEITRLLKRWTAGDVYARDQLIPLVYDRLRELAHQRLRSAPGEHTLNTTALVHEAYIRLVGAPRMDLPDRAHFLALASQIMRNLLVDRARARTTAKRGGDKTPLQLEGRCGSRMRISIPLRSWTKRSRVSRASTRGKASSSCIATSGAYRCRRPPRPSVSRLLQRSESCAQPEPGSRWS